VIFIGGSNFVAVRFSNAELPPFWGATIRFFPAAVLLAAAMAIWRVPVPRGAALGGAILYGAVNFGASYAAAYYGLQQVNAGTASVILATLPLFTVVLAAVHGLEPFRPRPIAGALVALVGIGIIFFDQVRADVAPIYLGAMVLNAALAAEATVIAKAIPRTHPVATNAVGMLVGAAILLAVSVAFGESHPLPQRADTQVALLYLATVGSLGLFGGILFVILRWRVTAASYALVVAPLVAVSLGALLRGEPIGFAFVIGAVIVAAGVYVGALAPSGGGREAVAG
jgi:drug/metabolite transporter (DMT)-like permease